jgi:hypothetical protein
MMAESQATTQAVLVTQVKVDEEQALERIALFDDDGDPISDLGSVTGHDVLLTGLTTGTATAPAATDTANEAIAKLHAEALTGFITSVTTATAIGTAAKTTTSAAPPANCVVAVKFTNGNSATSPTLNFNGAGAVNMLLGGTASAAAKIAVAAGGIALFFYDGTSLHQLGAYT